MKAAIFQRDNWLWLKKEMIASVGGVRYMPGWPRLYRGRRGLYMYDRYFPAGARFRAKHRADVLIPIIFVWLMLSNLDRFQKAPEYHGETGVVMIALFFSCVVWLFIFYPILRLTFRFFNRRRTKYFFRWDGKTRFSWWHQYPPGTEFQPRYVAHRKAADERRKIDQFYRTHPPNAKPPRTDYQDASQVDIDSGKGWWVLADFENDQAGHRATQHMKMVEDAFDLRNELVQRVAQQGGSIVLPPPFIKVLLLSPFVFLRWLASLPRSAIRAMGARMRGEAAAPAAPVGRRGGRPVGPDADR